MTTEVTITVTIEKVDRAGRRQAIWSRSVREEGGIPSHLAQLELLNVAHAQLHPPRQTKASQFD